ncbi:DUF72 domain-containing protein [Flavisphingomonas formosensis]|uniref:DUF72 domain-containing protein n=1 Tax=Flavisphingomonas formosensis TaxID=861534 RepID=UPI0018DFD621|nr:DUF72 domain-containing protein [Sphingomonas formosensis]
MKDADDVLPRATTPMRIGTAGWAIPRALRGHFAEQGSILERYALSLNAVEINSSFYRPHRASTYARWAESVPVDFRFSVKLPRSITHEHRLVGCEALLGPFAAGIACLGQRLGPLLVQLPPSLAFAAESVDRFFALLIRMFATDVVCEPRHPSWFTPQVDAFLADRRIARVAADPPVCATAARPGGWTGISYFRLHGSPRTYRSSYSATTLANMAAELRLQDEAECWVVFDNTAEGAALANALDLAALMA